MPEPRPGEGGNEFMLPCLGGARRIAAVIVALTSVFAAVGCGGNSSTSSSSSSETTSVRLLVYPGTTLSWAGYLAQNQGIFAKHHINVTFTQLPAGAQATNGLAGRALDIAMLDPMNMAPLLAKGLKFQLLVGEMDNYWVILSGKDVPAKPLDQVFKSVTSIGAPSVGGAGGRLAQYLGHVYGNRNPNDIKILADTSGAGLLSNSYQYLVADPAVGCTLSSQGANTIFNFHNPPGGKNSYPAAVQSLIGLGEFGYWASPDWTKAHPQGVKDFQTAIQETITWAKSHQPQVATVLRKSSFNLAALSDSQFQACVASILPHFQSTFTSDDAKTWSKVISTLDIAQGGLPATKQWFAPGLPQ